MKSDQKKIIKYVQSGSLLKLKSFLEKYNSGKKKKFDLNFRVGDLNRTPLHIACLLGDDSVVRCLLSHGASTELLDRNKDTPVHIAAQYVCDSGHFPDYKLLLQPLLVANPSVINFENKQGETATEILQKAKEKYQAFKKFDEESKEDEKSSEQWNKKLAHEMEAEYSELSKQDGFASSTSYFGNDDYQTYDQWADQIFAEYERKNFNRNNKKRRKELQNLKRKQELDDITSHLMKDHEEYVAMAKRMRTEVLNQKRERYEQKISSIKSRENEGKLRFRDIPWPCQGNAAEMVEVLLSGLDDDSSKNDRKRYVLRQLVLWHPDKFEQRCGDRLLARDKERILDTVKAIAQELNKILSALKEEG